MKILALKIYVDSGLAYREGVPVLLDILDAAGVSGSIFFGMGTEEDGSMMSRFFRDEREIVGSAPGIIRDAFRRRHDCGVYSWNPREWQARLDRIKDTTLDSDIKRAADHFFRRTGARPNGSAAPGWRVNYMSLRIQDDVRFKYCSDTFGFYPFRPKMSWKTFATPQVPSTLPPIEVVMQKASTDDVRMRLAELIFSLPDGLSVLPLSAAVGCETSIVEPFAEFLSVCAGEGVRFMTLDQVIASLDVDALPSCEIVSAQVFGMNREVALQSLD